MQVVLSTGMRPALPDYLNTLPLCAAYCRAAETNQFEGSPAGRHFAVPAGMSAGTPYPLGPTLVSTGKAAQPKDVPCTLNFAVSCVDLLNWVFHCLLSCYDRQQWTVQLLHLLHACHHGPRPLHLVIVHVCSIKLVAANCQGLKSQQ